jgi:hypothetical protein
MEDGQAKEPTSFEEFWPRYLAAHSDPRTRMMHVIGTAVGLGCAALSISTREPLWAIAALVAAYGAAWLAHAIFERNTPATFSYPLWSVRGDLRMLKLALTGRLDQEAAAQREASLTKKRISEGT